MTEFEDTNKQNLTSSHLWCCSPAEGLGTCRCDTKTWPPTSLWLAEASDAPPPCLPCSRPRGCRRHTASPPSASSASGPAAIEAPHIWRSCPGCGCWAPAASWPGCPGSSGSSKGCSRGGGRWGGAGAAGSPRRLFSVCCAGGAGWWAARGRWTHHPPPWRCGSAGGPGSSAGGTGRTCCPAKPKWRNINGCYDQQPWLLCYASDDYQKNDKSN